jgi:hypothetical protein
MRASQHLSHLVGSRATRRSALACVTLGGILTQSLSSSYRVFSNMHEYRMIIVDFSGLSLFNLFNPSA